MKKMTFVVAAAFTSVATFVVPAGAASASGASSVELQQAATAFDDATGRYQAAALDGTTDATGDADDPRGDITHAFVDNATESGDITLGLGVSVGDSFGSSPWSRGLTGVLWNLSTNGDTTPDYVVTIVSDGTGHLAVTRPSSESVLCEGVPAALPADDLYGGVFPASCIGSPATIRVQAYMSYDYAYTCSSCPTSEDITGWSAAVARGQSSSPSPNPTPNPSPAPTPSPRPGTNGGYYFVASDGGVFAFGAPFHGAAAGQTSSPVVGLATNPTGPGYWIVEANGRVHSRGVNHFGDMAGRQLTAPIVDIAVTADGGGYYLLGADGGIFSFGNAPFHGSTGNLQLNQPVIALATN